MRAHCFKGISHFRRCSRSSWLGLRGRRFKGISHRPRGHPRA
ncbi:hypothetical protein COLSTE_01383 [Collinsella stercoris DSM 13279]|uniref:Uncharacterized protein n=1 Tax=Collinsella stercoris DSM 13279 TaxID=445975 RepID=B6GBC4_9ACTN|nr:hypothetical protein COLSTE_01383 [Collinsella stercoris DSM 13279]